MTKLQPWALGAAPQTNTLLSPGPARLSCTTQADLSSQVVVFQPLSGAGVAKPQPWALGGAPKTITLLSAVDAEPVANQGALLHALGDLGSALGYRVRPYSVSTSAPSCVHIAQFLSQRAGCEPGLVWSAA